MGPRKKSTTPKTPSRPRGRLGPSTDIALSSTRSGTRNKSNMNGKIMKTPSKKKYIPAYLDEDDDGDFEYDDEYENDGSRNLRSKAVEDEYIESDDASEVGNDSEDVSPAHSKSKTKSNVAGVSKRNYSRRNPGAVPDPNGRVKGRDLVPWTRARMTEKLMLHLVYECEVAGIKLPWDAAVKRLHPGSKEGAATQHLGKLRTILLTEGHLVPPKARTRNRLAADNSPDIRGYIRPDGAGPYETREVGWDEKIEDLSKSIENPEIIRGSGRYPRNKKTPANVTRKRGQNSTPVKAEPSSAGGTRATRRKQIDEALDRLAIKLQAEAVDIMRASRRRSTKLRMKNDRSVQDDDDYGGGDEESDSDNGSAGESDIENDEEACEDSDDDVVMDERVHADVEEEAEDSVKDAGVEEEAEDSTEGAGVEEEAEDSVEGAGAEEEAEDSVEEIIRVPDPANTRGPLLLSYQEAVEYGSLAAFERLAELDPDGNLATYSSGPDGQPIMYDGFDGLGNGMSEGLAMGDPYDQNMDIPDLVYYAVPSMGQTAGGAVIPPPSNVFSGGDLPGARYQQYPPDPFLDLARGRSNYSRGVNRGFEIATDHTATAAYSLNPPPVFSENNLSIRNFGPGPAGDKENEITGLNHTIPNPRR